MIAWITGVKTTADWGHVWLQAKVRERGLRLRPRLYAGSVTVCGVCQYISAMLISHTEKACTGCTCRTVSWSSLAAVVSHPVSADIATRLLVEGLVTVWLQRLNRMRPFCPLSSSVALSRSSGRPISASSRTLAVYDLRRLFTYLFN